MELGLCCLQAMSHTSFPLFLEPRGLSSARCCRGPAFCYPVEGGVQSAHLHYSSRRHRSRRRSLGSKDSGAWMEHRTRESDDFLTIFEYASSAFRYSSSRVSSRRSSFLSRTLIFFWRRSFDSAKSIIFSRSLNSICNLTQIKWERPRLRWRLTGEVSSPSSRTHDLMFCISTPADATTSEGAPLPFCFSRLLLF